MKKRYTVLAVVLALVLLSSCASVCPAYESNSRYERPRHEPTHKKDYGHKKR